jgi:hypothetical protein
MINLQVDRRLDKTTTVKSQQISPFPKFIEWDKPGIAQWPAIKAQGKLTLQNQPSVGETITLGTKTYSFVASLVTNTDGQIVIGANVAATRSNIMAAVNLSGLPGSQYASATSLNADVEATSISGNDIIFTAKIGGTVGNSIVSTSTLVSPNTFDAVTLGTYRIGTAASDADSVIIPSYRGTFNTSTAQQYANRELFYVGRSQWDGDEDRAFGNQNELIREFPHHDYLMSAGSTRKMYALNFLERRVKSVKTLTMYTKLRDIESQTLSSPFAKSTNNRVFKTIELDSTRFITFYRQQAGTSGIYAVVGNTNTNGTITWGAPLLMYTVDWYNENFDACLINTDKVLITIPVTTNFINTAVVTISGTGIALNTPVQVINFAAQYKQLVKVGTDKAILAFENGANIHLYCVSVSGTVPSYGSLASIASTSKPLLAANGNDKCQIAYIGSGGWYSAVVTTSGSTITVQAGVQISYETSYSYRYNYLFPLSTDTFVFWSHWGTIQYQSRNRQRAGLLTVSGTNTTLASSAYLPSGWYGDRLMYPKAIDATSFYLYSYESNRITGAKVTLTGTTLNFPNMTYKGFGWNENQGDQQIYKYQIWDNFPQIGDPVNCNGNMFFITTDNYTNGSIAVFSDKAFSFDLYNGDDYFGTYTKSDLGFMQKITVDIPIGKEEFGLKIKSNDSVQRFAQIDHMYLVID